MGDPTPRELLRHLYSKGTAVAFLKEHDEGYELISRWKKEEPGFADQFEEAICATRTSHHDRSVDAREPEWQDAFLSAYRQLGPIASIPAAHRVLQERGFTLSLGSIYVRMASSKPDYDEQFTNRFLNAEAQRIAPIEEKLTDQMAAGEIPGIAYKHLQAHPLTRDRFKAPAQNIKVDSTHTNIEERRLKLQATFLSNSHTMFGKETKDVSRIRGSAAEIGGDAPDVGDGPEGGSEAQPETVIEGESEVVEVEEEVAV